MPYLTYYILKSATWFCKVRPFDLSRPTDAALALKSLPTTDIVHPYFCLSKKDLVRYQLNSERYLENNLTNSWLELINKCLIPLSID